MKCIIVAKILNSIQRDRIELKEVESALSNAKDGMGIICYTAGITIEGFMCQLTAELRMAPLCLLSS